MHDRHDTQFFRQFLTPERLSRFAEIARLRTRSLTLVLENLHHSHNTAACLRSCEAFGIQDVHIIEEAGEYERHRTIDLGAQQWLTVSRYTHEKVPDPTAACLQKLRADGYRIVATVPQAGASTPSQLPLGSKTAILFGAEKGGISPKLLAAADDCLTIPMTGFTDSLNVSVAAAICLQQLVERIRREQSDWQLSEDEQRELIDEWICISVKHQLPRVYEQYFREQKRGRRRTVAE